MLIDTHCHLYEEYYDNLGEIIEEMKDNIMIVSGCDRKSNKEVLELIKKYDNIYGTLGIHPEEIENCNEEDLTFIENNLNNPKVVAIGEIGLDYHYTKDLKEEQKEIFRKQLRIAKKYNKAVVIHSRDAISDTIQILKEETMEENKIIFHCFSSSLEVAKILLKMNVMFGIGGVVTFKNGQKLKEIVKEIPLERLLLETDSPYLAPTPYRGSINKPSYVELVADEIAQIKEISKEEVIKKTTLNAINQFDLPI